MSLGNDSLAAQNSLKSTNRGRPPVSERPNRATDTSGHAPVAAKWIHDTEEEDDTDEVGLVPHNRGYKLKNWGSSDAQFGGYKLRPPRPLASEEELTKGGKRRTVIKRRRRHVEDEFSDDDDKDPYTQINVEDILSPIEVPTDIVYRPALKRIIKSPQIEELAETAMEFIESEKNFNKILSRLSAILHNDDPQYLDLNFERTPHQRKMRKQELERRAAKALLNQGNENKDGETTLRGTPANGSVHIKQENDDQNVQATSVKQNEHMTSNGVAIEVDASVAAESIQPKDANDKQETPSGTSDGASREEPHDNGKENTEMQTDHAWNKTVKQKPAEEQEKRNNEGSPYQLRNAGQEREAFTDGNNVDTLKKRSLKVADKENSGEEAQDTTDTAIEEDFSGPDVEALETVRTVRELLLENINFSNEYLSRLQSARDKLTKAYMQKDALWNQLKINAKKEKDRRRVGRQI